MTVDITVGTPSTSKSKGRQNAAKIVNGDLRLRIIKMWVNDIDNSFITSFDRILNENARQNSILAGINYEALSIMDRLLMTRFRCPLCGVLPLYYLDLKYLNKIRCGKCSMIVSLKNSSGKYGKIRKKIAIRTCRALDEMLGSN